MTDQPVDSRHHERLADLGVAWMLPALAALHVVTGAAVATVLDRRSGLAVGGADALAAAVLAGSALVAVRLGPHARRRDPAAAPAVDLTLITAALGVAGVATALRVVASGATWVAVEVPLVVVVAAALPRRRAVAAASAALAPVAGAVAGVVALGSRTASEVLAALLPAAAATVAAVVALAWRRRVVRLEERLLRAERAAHDLAVRDALTGVVKRSGLDLVAVPILEQARRQGEAAHCLFVDVDGFRVLNEAAGEAVGDDVLRAVAAALAGAVRSTDVVARWSGDEFVVVGPGTGTSPLELERRVHASLVQATPTPVEVWAPRVSIGSATLVPWDEGDLPSLLRRAEQDMRLRRSLRRQRADREGGTVAAPPQRPVPGGAEH